MHFLRRVSISLLPIDHKEICHENLSDIRKRKDIYVYFLWTVISYLIVIELINNSKSQWFKYVLLKIIEIFLKWLMIVEHDYLVKLCCLIDYVQSLLVLLCDLLHFYIVLFSLFEGTVNKVLIHYIHHTLIRYFKQF